MRIGDVIKSGYRAQLDYCIVPCVSYKELLFSGLHISLNTNNSMRKDMHIFHPLKQISYMYARNTDYETTKLLIQQSILLSN